MKKLVALILILAIAVFARRVGGDGSGRFATMALGLVLIAATLVGEAFEHFRLPRLTGYLLVGLAFGPSVLNLVTPGMAQHLRLVNGLAVALIAFSAGMELDIGRIRGQWRSLVRHGTILLGGLYLGLFLLMLAATPFLSFTAAQPWSRRIAIAVMTAAVMATFSPTVVMAVLSETRARGRFTDRILQLVILGDLAVILVFTGATTAAHLLDGVSVKLGSVVGHVAWEVLGSVAIGLAVGVGFSTYRRFVRHRTGLVIAGACLVLAEMGPQLGLSPLLCCLAAGFVVRNVEPSAAHQTEHLLERVRLPVLVVFFAAAGASLHIAQVLAVLPLTIGVVLARGGLIVGANRLASRVAGVPGRLGRHLPLGLISQAGVALGLAVIVGREFPGWGEVLETLFVAAISLHELVGPIALRLALQRMGELPEKAPEEQPEEILEGEEFEVDIGLNA